MEPIFFKPSYKHVIWGGNKISKIFGRNLEDNDIGESWELSAHPSGLSTILNGEFKYKNINDLFNDKTLKTQIFGTNCEHLSKFPIIAKFIDATKNLSIQVHPDNEYALKNENDSGKTEVWYVMDCKEDAKLVYGFKENVTKENLKNAIDNIEESVNYVNVHKGDFISIPAGTIHAIMDGIVVCEVQQSSDITYRLYDWNRSYKNGQTRELHKEKALDVINLNAPKKIYNYYDIDKTTNIYGSNIFNIDIVKVEEKINDISNSETFFTYIVIEGYGYLTSGNFKKDIFKGETFLIPANLGEYTILGNLKLMKIWI